MQRFQQAQHILKLEISHETLSNSNHPSAIIIAYRKTEGRGIMQSEKPWLSQYPEEIPHELEFTDQTLPSNLTNSAAQFPNHTAIYFLGKTHIPRRSHRFIKASRFLRKTGLKKVTEPPLCCPIVRSRSSLLRRIVCRRHCRSDQPSLHGTRA